MIGFLEAAGSEGERRILHRPLAVVRHEDGEPSATTRPTGLWFLEPLPRPRPEPGGVRRALPARLAALAPEWLVRRFAPTPGLNQ